MDLVSDQCVITGFRARKYFFGMDPRAKRFSQLARGFSQHKLHPEFSLCAHTTDMEQEESRRFETIETDGSSCLSNK